MVVVSCFVCSCLVCSCGCGRIGSGCGLWLVCLVCC